MFYFLLVIAAIVISYISFHLGKQAKKEELSLTDPDNDQDLSEDDSTMLFFTKTDRYKLGRAMAIGTKKEIAEAKKNLEFAVGITRDNEIRRKIEELQNKHSIVQK